MKTLYYWFTWTLAKIFSWIYFPIKIYGGENIPKKGAFIFASNHISYLDPVTIPICTTRRMGFVAKETLFDHWFIGFSLRMLGSVPIRRESADIRAIKGIISLIKSGRPVLIFPEGTRIPREGEKEVQAGIGFIATKTNVPVVPVCVENSDITMPPGAKWPKRHRINVTFGEPVYFSKDKEHIDIANEIMKKIYALSLKDN